MEWILPSVALALAAAALAVALAALRAARRAPASVHAPVAREDPAPEARPTPAAAAARAAAEQALQVAEALGARVDVLERREVEATRPAPVYPREAVGRVRAHLEALGWSQVSVLPADASGSRFTVEGRREGLTSKGRAQVDAAGDVVLQVAAATRAFP